MKTSTQQRAAFVAIAVVLIATASVAFAAVQNRPRPILVTMAPTSDEVVSPALPAAPQPAAATEPVTSAPASGLPAPVRSALIERAEPLAAATVDAPAVSPALQRAPEPVTVTDIAPVAEAELAAPAPAEEELAVTAPAEAELDAEAMGMAGDDGPVRDTTHSGDLVELEVTVSKLPDTPGVAVSHGTEVVTVNRNVADPWAPVRHCESTGNYGINTGNGFYGAYQFTISTWNWVAEIIGRDDLVGIRPDRAAPSDQDRMADALAFEIDGGGLHHWPVCGRHYGT